MKIIYIDESGGNQHTDSFVMCGIMIDAYRLRKTTAVFDQEIQSLLKRNPNQLNELKTSDFIRGKTNWSCIDIDERKKILKSLCQFVVERGITIFGIGLSMKSFKNACGARLNQSIKNDHWLAGAMFVSCLVQKKMQPPNKSRGKNKGLTFVVVDENPQKAPHLASELYKCDPWFDGLYQASTTRRGKMEWEPRKSSNRFDQIINTPFTIKSDHSYLIQVADAVSFVYRRHLELMSSKDAPCDDKNYYDDLVNVLAKSRQKLGRCPDAPCVKFFELAAHPKWEL